MRFAAAAAAILAATALTTPAALAQNCDRACLEGWVDRYLDALGIQGTFRQYADRDRGYSHPSHGRQPCGRVLSPFSYSETGIAGKTMNM
jgi:hypothetical protein